MQVLCVINFLFLIFVFVLSCTFVTVMVTVEGKLLRLCVLTASMSAIWNWCSGQMPSHSSKSEPCVRLMRPAATVMRNSSSRSSENIPAGIASSFCIRVVKRQRHSHMFTVLDCDKNYNRHYSWLELRSQSLNCTAHFSNNINLSPVNPVDVLKLWVFVLWCFGQEACPE